MRAAEGRRAGGSLLAALLAVATAGPAAASLPRGHDLEALAPAPIGVERLLAGRAESSSPAALTSSAPSPFGLFDPAPAPGGLFARLPFSAESVSFPETHVELLVVPRPAARFRLYLPPETRVPGIDLADGWRVEVELASSVEGIGVCGCPRLGISPGGTFITPDPMGYLDSPNPYQYAGNNPFNFSDPLGLCMGTDCTFTEEAYREGQRRQGEERLAQYRAQQLMAARERAARLSQGIREVLARVPPNASEALWRAAVHDYLAREVGFSQSNALMWRLFGPPGRCETRACGVIRQTGRLLVDFGPVAELGLELQMFLLPGLEAGSAGSRLTALGLVDELGLVEAPRLLATVPRGQLPWRMWGEYERVALEGREYAQIGERLWTRHAVERTYPRGWGAPAGAPSGTGPGRAIAPNLVEDVIQSGSQRTVVVQGLERTIHTSGTVEVVTEQGGRIVVSVNPFSGGG